MTSGNSSATNSDKCHNTATPPPRCPRVSEDDNSVHAVQTSKPIQKRAKSNFKAAALLMSQTLLDHHGSTAANRQKTAAKAASFKVLARWPQCCLTHPFVLMCKTKRFLSCAGQKNTYASNTESTTANRHIGVVLKSHNCQLQLNTDSNESKHTEAQLPTKRLAPFRSLISASCNLIPVLMVLRRCTRPRPRRPVAAADACLVRAVCTVPTLLKTVHWLLDRCQNFCKLQLIKPHPWFLSRQHRTPPRRANLLLWRSHLLGVASSCELPVTHLEGS